MQQKKVESVWTHDGVNLLEVGPDKALLDEKTITKRMKWGFQNIGDM